MTTPAQQDLIDTIADGGRFWANVFRLPLPAMIACGCLESGWGSAGIYKRTNCPFMLQKPQSWFWPNCPTLQNDTVNHEGQAASPAPFRVAEDMSDACRIWCEWVRFYNNGKRHPGQDRLLSMTRRPADFAQHLPLVGFADNKMEKGVDYRNVVTQHKLLQPKYDAGESSDDVFALFMGRSIGTVPSLQAAGSQVLWTTDGSCLRNWLIIPRTDDITPAPPGASTSF